MKKLLTHGQLALSVLRLLPHVGLFVLADTGGLVMSDVLRWAQVLYGAAPTGRLQSVVVFARLMTFYPEFRNLFYKRMGLKGRVFAFMCAPLSTLYIATDRIGRGLFIQHGFATIIAAESIGDNCWINQQVTVGYAADGGKPTLGNNVVINAGAKVIGGVQVGSNTKIGANAVVVKSTPANVTVVGIPARIVKRDGVRCDEAL